MTIYEMQPDEVILYEGNVSCPKIQRKLAGSIDFAKGSL